MNIKVYKQGNNYILENTNGLKRRIRYSDNLKEILEQENIIDIIKNDKKSIIDTIENADIVLVKERRINNNLKWILTTATCIAGIGVASAITGLDKEIILTIFTTSAAWGALYFCTKEISNKKIKTWESIVNGNVAEYEYLEEELEKQKSVLYQLNLNDSFDKEDTFEEINLPNPDLEEINNKRSFYNTVGRDYIDLVSEYNFLEYQNYINSLSKEELVMFKEFMESHKLENGEITRVLKKDM